MRMKAATRRLEKPAGLMSMNERPMNSAAQAKNADKAG